MIASQIRTSLLPLVRLCVAFFVLVSANHCFLEEGLGSSPHRTSYTKDFSKLNYHFGASFGHDHSGADDATSESDHAHGDTASLNHESSLQKVKKNDGQSLASFVETVLLSSVMDSKFAVNHQLLRNFLVPLNEPFVSRGIQSLASAPQAPPVRA